MGTALNGMAFTADYMFSVEHSSYSVTMFVQQFDLSAIMGVPVTYVFTHDSVAVGEDGPTHEPVEHLASLRAMPGLSVIRPADANETAAAWKMAVSSEKTPTALILSRQNLPVLPKSAELSNGGCCKRCLCRFTSKKRKSRCHSSCNRF